MSLQKKFDKVTFVRMLVVIGLLGLTSLSLAQDTWTPKTEMPTGRLWFSCEVVDGKIYAIGGATRSGAPTLATVEEYDAVSDSWTSKQDMLTARWNMASAVVDGKIYTIGGALSFQIGVSAGVGTLEVYDPANDTWTAKDDAPTAREAASASVVNGMIYVMGGGAPGGVILNLVEAYDPATDTWTEKTSMRYKRHALSTCVVDGKIYAMGGGRGEWDVEEYDPATDNWTTKVPMLVGVGYFGAGVIDGIIYTVGGGSGPGTPKARLFAYDPVTAPLSVVEEYTPETVSVENYSSHNPKSFVLHQNYPNPFNPETGIKYEISKPTRVVLKVMNLLGQNVRTLVDEEKPTGFFEVMWDGKDDHGKRVASGVYLYILETKDPSKGSGQGFVKTRKMLLLQ
jgi:hypothetical protein